MAKIERFEEIKAWQMAKGSAGEVRSQLFVALELGYLTAEEFSDLRTKAEEVSKALSGFISYLTPEGSKK